LGRNVAGEDLISCCINIKDVQRISTVEHCFKANFIVCLTWQDMKVQESPRFKNQVAQLDEVFAFGEGWDIVGAVVVHRDDIEEVSPGSVPKMKFDNQVDTTENRNYVYITKDCIRIEVDITGTFLDDFDARQFPFDIQDFRINVHLFPGEVKKRRFIKEHNDPLWAIWEGRIHKRGVGLMSTEHTSVSEWKVDPLSIRSQVTDQVDWDAIATFAFDAERDHTSYTTSLIYPSIMLDFLAVFSYFLHVEDLGDRNSMTTTMILAQIALKFVVSNEIPKYSYMTLLDKKFFASFVVSFMIIFIQQLEYVYEVSHDTNMYLGWASMAVVVLINSVYFIEGLLKDKNVTGNTVAFDDQ